MPQRYLAGVIVTAFLVGFFGSDLRSLVERMFSSETETTFDSQQAASSPHPTNIVGNPNKGVQGRVIASDSYQVTNTNAGQEANPTLQQGPMNPSTPSEWKSFSKSVEAISPNQIDEQRKIQHNAYFEKLREQMNEMKLAEQDPMSPPPPSGQLGSPPLIQENPDFQMDEGSDLIIEDPNNEEPYIEQTLEVPANEYEDEGEPSLEPEANE